MRTACLTIEIEQRRKTSLLKLVPNWASRLEEIAAKGGNLEVYAFREPRYAVEKGQTMCDRQCCTMSFNWKSSLTRRGTSHRLGSIWPDEPPHDSISILDQYCTACERPDTHTSRFRSTHSTHKKTHSSHKKAVDDGDFAFASGLTTDRAKKPS